MGLLKYSRASPLLWNTKFQYYDKEIRYWKRINSSYVKFAHLKCAPKLNSVAWSPQANYTDRAKCAPIKSFLNWLVLVLNSEIILRKSNKLWSFQYKIDNFPLHPFRFAFHR
jgi:hypothetical protein